MVLVSELKKERYKPGEIAKMLGVTPRTVLNYKDSGVLIMHQDEETKRWYADTEELKIFLRKKKLLYDDVSNSVQTISIIYARVSSHDQKKNGDLDRQIEFIKNKLHKENNYAYQVYSDVSSGLNANRSGLNKVIEAVQGGFVKTVYVTYKDRLTRFGFEYLEKMFKYHGVEIIVLKDDKNKTEQQELVDDMMSLIASFSGKLYGMRSRKKK